MAGPGGSGINKRKEILFHFTIMKRKIVSHYGKALDVEAVFVRIFHWKIKDQGKGNICKSIYSNPGAVCQWLIVETMTRWWKIVLPFNRVVSENQQFSFLQVVIPDELSKNYTTKYLENLAKGIYGEICVKNTLTYFLRCFKNQWRSSQT